MFAEFQAWKESPTWDKSCPFLERIYQEDVGPCLDFTKHEVNLEGGAGQVTMRFQRPFVIKLIEIGGCRDIK